MWLRKIIPHLLLREKLADGVVNLLENSFQAFVWYPFLPFAEIAYKRFENLFVALAGNIAWLTNKILLTRCRQQAVNNNRADICKFGWVKSSWSRWSFKFVEIICCKTLQEEDYDRVWNDETSGYGENWSIKSLLHVETFSWNLCATALRNMFQQALHCVTWSVSWNVLNFCCETSFTKSRTAFYFCNGRNDHSGDKNESFTV